MDTLANISDRIKSLVGQLTAWQGVVYRQCGVKYATNRDLLTGSGSSLYGGRWNPKGVKTVYASLTPETAMAEALSNFRYYGMNVAKAMPRVFVAVECRFEKVLNLTVGSIRQRLRVSHQRMLDDWRRLQAVGRPVITQLIGQAASAAGIEAILAPAGAFGGGENIVWFPGNLTGKSKATILASDKLPK
jgi:RES domain-containing protein